MGGPLDFRDDRSLTVAALIKKWLLRSCAVTVRYPDVLWKDS